MSQRTALYRLYDPDRKLLYVGISNNPERRWDQHRRKQSWWPEVAHREISEWYPTRQEAILAEAAIIRAERPPRNLHVPQPNGRFGIASVIGGRRATGQTPVHNMRIAGEIWFPAMARAKAEGRTISSVLVTYLQRYVSTPPRMPHT